MMKKSEKALDGINFLLQCWMLIGLLLLVSKSLYFRHEFSTIALWTISIYGLYTLSGVFRSVYTFILLPAIVMGMTAGLALTPLFFDPIIMAFSRPAAGAIQLFRVIYNEGALNNQIHFMIQHILGKATVIPYGYDHAMMILFVILVGAIFYGLSQIKSKVALMIPVLFFVIQWLRYFDVALSLMNFYIIGLITYVIVNQDGSKLTLSATGLVSRRRILLLYGLCFALMISVMSTVTLAVYPLEKVNKAVSKFMPTLFDVRTGYSNPSNRIFTFANTIYKPYGNRLGGSISLKHDVVMTVRGNAAGLYLRGRVNDLYDGKNWSSSSPDFNIMTEYTEVEPEHVLEAYKLEIVYKAIETATIFAPYSFYASNLSPKKVYQNPDGALFYKKGPFDKKLTSYMVKGVLDTSLPYLQTGEGKDVKYRKLPDSMPDKVRIMALQATIGSKNDRETMERLVSFLTKDYTYSLTVEDVPETADFVHHFLTTSKKGYCTYFASALATMGRSVGVSTRYIEGFVVPKTRSGDNTYHVTADLAHAWVEAYIEGEGWVVFEATPTYTVSVPSDSLTEDLPEPGALMPNIFNRDEKDIEDQFAGDSNYVQKKPILTWERALILALLSLMTLLILRVVRIQKSLAIQFKGTVKTNTLRQYYQIEQLMALIDNTYHRFNTPELLIQRIFDFMRITSLDKNVVLLIVNKALFSQHEVISTDLGELSRVHAYVDQFAVARLGRFKYWYYKYILNRMTLKRRGHPK
jgi:transglutaminase-like putative cysteine protease